MSDPVLTGDAGEVRSPSVLPATLSLFASFATFFCCALPALLVSVGLGAAMAGVYSAAPELQWLGRNKEVVFAVATLLIAAAGVYQWWARALPCPADPAKARACSRLRTISWVLWWISVAALAVGGFFAFVAVHLFF